MSIMDSDIFEAHRHNDEPSPALVTEIKRRMTQPILELQRRNEEIEGLTRAMDALGKECDDLEASIADHQTILSPIRRLPPDILHEIFYHCLPTHRNPVMSEREAPILFTVVCRSWRSIALSSPRLWTRVHIPIRLPRKQGDDDDDDDAWGSTFSGYEVDEEDTREDSEKYILFHRNRLHAWLSRSGALALSVSLSYSGSTSQREFEDGTALKQFFDTLFTYLPAITDLELAMPTRIYPFLFAHLSPSSFPSLRRIKLDFAGRPNSTGPISLIDAPNLESMSIALKAGSSIGPFWEPSSSALCHLTSLSIHYRLKTDVAFRILKRYPQLRFCKMNIYNPNEALYPLSEEKFLLPQLVVLVLSVDTNAGMEEIFRQMDAPSLTHFNFQETFRRFGYNPPAPDQNFQPSLGVHHFLERCNVLTKLTLDASCTASHDIFHCLSSASQITHLVIGQRFRKFTRPVDYFWDARRQRNFDLNVLVIQPFPTSNFENLTEKSIDMDAFRTPGIILLPRLEVFEAGAMTGKATYEIVKKFVLSRVGGSAIRNGVRSLRRVNIAFDRPPPAGDLAMDIQDAAKAEGMEITVQLHHNSFEPFPWPTAADPSSYPWESF
ncbi:hypothetical protein CVT26_015337 [Gymnopilus dilepis]|uniref:Uncharacterized protein n=1 Tax=Gymnopilus dilepis TaxID=231916 RepID=A0A409W453_9AGAR|nr:hypothetical protein CVT26_015337 [Gymnopilus dilepis]